MKELKKGAQPKKENTQTQEDNITLFVICIVNFLASFVLLLVGKHTGCSAVTGLGAGIAFVTLELSLWMNRED